MQFGKRGYGLDFGTNGRPILIRADRIGFAWKFTAIQRDHPAFLRQQAAGRHVAATLYCRESLIRPVEAPLRDARKALRVLPSVLDIQLPFAIEDCISLFLDPAPTPAGGTSALAIAARRRDIADRLTVLSAGGFDPAILDHEGLALWTQSLRESPTLPPTTLHVLICLGEDEATLVIGRGKHILGCHSIRPAALPSIQRILAGYPAPDGKVAYAFCGGATNLPDRARALHTALSLDRPGSLRIHKDPETFLARALAVRAAGGGLLPCNLRIDAFEHPRAIRRTSRSIHVAIGTVAASGLILAAAGSLALFVAQKRETATANAVSRMADDVAGYHIAARGEDAIRLTKTALAERRRTLRPFLDVTAPSLVDRMADITYFANRDRLRIESLSLSQTNLSAAGLAQAWTACDALVNHLQSLGYPVVLHRKEAMADYWIPFTLTVEARHD